MPVDIKINSPNPAANDFVEHITNQIALARDQIMRTQQANADAKKHKFRNIKLAVGDLVLLNTENYNLQLPSKKLAPRWLGPLKVLQIRGPNTVLINVPQRFSQISPIQNVLHLKPYVSSPPEIGLTVHHPPPDLIDGKEEFEVEDILAHRVVNSKNQYLVQWLEYAAEDDEWLPEKNLKNSPALLKEYWDRQCDNFTQSPLGPQRALRKRKSPLFN
eukprot:232998-Rhodomonas_salina.3